MRPIVCRTLRREYRLHPPSDEVALLLRFVEATPDLPAPPLEIADIPVRCRDGFVVATLPSGEVVEGTPNHLLGAMHRIILADLVEGEPGAPFLHGATVMIAGRRILLVGHKGSGKSTLSLHLVFAGYDVEGDEHLIIRDSEVVARPRTLRVKEGSLRLVPDLPDEVWKAPSIHNWDGSMIRSISPSAGGRPWVIRPGKLDAMIFLVANHGGRSAARPIPGKNAFGRLMGEVMLPRTGVATAAGRLRRVAMEVPAYQLLLGDLTTAEWHLGSIAAELT
ncbi:hypothetical protein VW23_004495 [Devosia insulae DS-56]|uniref:HPr kinase/phosphorylase C-terminal domain-containing protein n=1 Tax=Devosia insulae DS-56 TaxID=1116389 RepID=A0A1E5XIU6_9HYPH|nr:hypothetical protein [Devosia insulae]OEO28522.1 hypothetical protein VW23_004495 [Devosia insulae DS-56]